MACNFVFAQNEQQITATLHENAKSINIQQKITFTNHSKDTLNQIYLYDWNNAYQNKNTALAKRFAEEFDKSLHFANEEQRGNTKIISLIDKNFNPLNWKRLEADDIIKVQLKSPVYPGENYILDVTYTIKLPSAEFTGYGYNKNGRIKLEYWYLSPIPYTTDWNLYSNMNLNDMYLEPSNYSIGFNYPISLHLTTNADSITEKPVDSYIQSKLYFKNAKSVKFYLEPTKTFTTIETEHVLFKTNIVPVNISEPVSFLSLDKVSRFLNTYLDNKEQIKILISESDYRKNPIYGLSQLPSFLRPFQDQFIYELKLLKTSLNNYLLEAIDADPRKDKWVFDTIETYLMMQFIEDYYPDMKMAGNFANIWGIKSFHFSQMDFNEQYQMYYMLMARKHIDQPMSMERDSLIKFNNNIANKYKAGIGLKYLDDYNEDKIGIPVISEFLNSGNTTKENFENLLVSNSKKDINWFFNDYVNSTKKIDYKITCIKENKDSLNIRVKNKMTANVPISLYTFKNKQLVNKYWLENINDTKTINIKNNGEDKFVLNYEKIIPEYNQRNNYKSTKGFLLNHKPLQVRLFQDAEDPNYNQVFFMPEFGFNLYDGLILGTKLYNKTLLTKPFLYTIRPQYGFSSKDIVGGASVQYRQFVENSNLFLINYALSGAYYHYAEGLVYKSFTPSVSFTFRPEDLRSNKRQRLNVRAVNIERQEDTLVVLENPSYTVFNARYLNYNNDILNYKSWFIDAQVGNKFSKVSFNYEYRKLYNSNRQLNIRVFGGKFIHNNTNTNYFDFALDRPTDYLFDYNYLGRSENSGLFSQQLIMAEGGFKSKLIPQYSNDWMLTTNFSTSIYRWIEAYGDLGFVKNKHMPTKFVYDSGIRLNLVTDYFELYLPVYSNNGWEISDPSYANNIRFVVTISPRALTGLFTRKWF
ncbi:metalloprotease [Neptunitalea chrysea]|uniref:metalloprotease n=1 Tax=Neptunitalea chrysea TaxID=1647581 RepID=UPI0024938609|nr:metalloprotease [Neptunitalea chrysea]